MSEPASDPSPDRDLQDFPHRVSCWHPGGIEGSRPSYEEGGFQTEYTDRVSPRTATADELRHERGLRDSCWHVGGVAPEQPPVSAQNEIERMRAIAMGAAPADDRPKFGGTMVGFYHPYDGTPGSKR